MSAPLGPDNINTTGWPFLVSASGHGDSTFTTLPSHDQDFVKDRFKDRFIGTPGSGPSVWTGSGGPMAQLADLLGADVGPLLGVARAMARAQLGVTTAWTDFNTMLQDAADFFSGRWTDVDSAGAAAAYALAQLAVKNRPIVDTFDRAAGVPGSNWDIRHVGGGGSARLDGLGHLVWSPSGGVAATDRMRWNAADTATDYQVVSTVMSLRPASPFAGGNSYVYPCARVNSGFDTFVTPRISFGGVVLLGFIADNQTVLASNPVTVGNGDTWDFLAGDPTIPDPYKFVVIRNGVAVITVDDTTWDGAPAPLSTVTQYGSGLRSVGVGMHAADRSLFTAQTSPGALVVFSADDQ